jgi:ribosomal protein S18 acetylase RimI-like enzyme
MNIRPATSDDVPAVLPMVQKLCALHETWDPERYGFLPQVADMYHGWLANRARDPRSVFLVGEREAKPVAFLIGTVDRAIPIYRVPEFGFIHDVWVEPEYRHEGIARQMTMLAIEKFREMGMKQVRLETAALNDVARDLFVSCGFRVSAVEMMYEIRGEAGDQNPESRSDD